MIRQTEWISENKWENQVKMKKVYVSNDEIAEFSVKSAWNQRNYLHVGHAIRISMRFTANNCTSDQKHISFYLLRLVCAHAAFWICLHEMYWATFLQAAHQIETHTKHTHICVCVCAE